MFRSSTKREIRHCHVVVVQRRLKNVQKSVMHMQSYSFTNLNLLMCCHPRCRRCRLCLNSLQDNVKMRRKILYYIHTEKYSPKSYVVNFRTQISSSQSEERTMVFTREKNDTSNQKPQRFVSFAPKFPPFIAACSATSHRFNEKSFTQRVSLAKKVKNISEMEWNSFVCFTVIKKTVESRRNNS